MVLLYWCVATVATAVSPVKKAAFSGWTKLTLYLIIFALLSRLLRSPRIRSWLIAVYLHAALVVSAYGIRQWFFKVEALATWTDPTSTTANVTRVYSFLGNPNLLAGYLLPAVVFSLAAFFVWRGWGPKLLALTMFLLNSGCLVLTYSRGGWIGFAVALLAMILLLVLWFSVDLPPVWRRWGVPATLGGLAAILVVAVVLVEPVRDRIFSMFAGREDSSNNFRINVWESVRQMIRYRPILGIGPGNVAFNQVYPLFMKPKFSALSAYSIWLEVAVETGLIGFSFFVWLLIVTFNQARVQFLRLRDLRSVDAFWLMAAVASMLGMLSHGFVDTVWYRPEVSTLWWLVVGMIASFYSVRRRVVNEGEVEAI
jgi:putative inorganic carbon (HCO3(-)) transporter